MKFYLKFIMLMVASCNWGGQLLFRLLGQLEMYEEFCSGKRPSGGYYGTFTVQSNFSWRDLVEV